MTSVPELIDRGIKLYMAGRVREAREAFQLAVDLDPKNEKARSYLLHIREAGPAGAGAATPVEAPASQAQAVASASAAASRAGRVIPAP